LERFSYRFAEEVLNSKLKIKQEVEDILTSTSIFSSIFATGFATTANPRMTTAIPHQLAARCINGPPAPA
jgi:hypothetical protein